MPHFICEAQFIAELQGIEEFPECDELVIMIEEEWRCATAPDANGYGVLRLSWRSVPVLAYYVANGCDITLISIRRCC
ncbi:MAG: hypothetical protein M3Y72_02740 [Acidobacteriota bacterium]|nr:hypothetical protein [Acidobacteriota bacterium]